MDRRARDRELLPIHGPEPKRLELHRAGQMVTGLEPDLVLLEIGRILQVHPGDSLGLDAQPTERGANREALFLDLPMEGVAPASHDEIVPHVSSQECADNGPTIGY